MRALTDIFLTRCGCRSAELLISGAVATEPSATLIPLGPHALRGIASPCADTAPDG
jgi:hypothetical protein